MILILSDDQFQHSIDLIILWLKKFNCEFIRLNNFDPNNIDLVKINLSDDEIYINDNLIDFNKINVIWNYRFGTKIEYNYTFDGIIESQQNRILNHILKSNDIISQYFFTKISNKTWFNFPANNTVNKLLVLKKAKEIGLKIPNTLISNKKKDLEDFTKKNSENITKPIWEVYAYQDKKHHYSSYTTAVNFNDSYFKDELTCFPSLIQSRINKKYEIRSFFLNEKFYSMAIFSQENEQTKDDFRIYDQDKPSRNIPFKLPNEIEIKLNALMKFLNLKTGSIDLLYSNEGEFYFLEINPVGQFIMTSNPCNYHLDFEIAKTLNNYDY
jgi:ATP-GRASP peptide maturase of grasp-with-spasm system